MKNLPGFRNLAGFCAEGCLENIKAVSNGDRAILLSALVCHDVSSGNLEALHNVYSGM